MTDLQEYVQNLRDDPSNVDCMANEALNVALLFILDTLELDDDSIASRFFRGNNKVQDILAQYINEELEGM